IGGGDGQRRDVEVFEDVILVGTVHSLELETSEHGRLSRQNETSWIAASTLRPSPRKPFFCRACNMASSPFSSSGRSFIHAAISSKLHSAYCSKMPRHWSALFSRSTSTFLESARAMR